MCISSSQFIIDSFLTCITLKHYVLSISYLRNVYILIYIYIYMYIYTGYLSCNHSVKDVLFFLYLNFSSHGNWILSQPWQGGEGMPKEIFLLGNTAHTRRSNRRARTEGFITCIKWHCLSYHFLYRMVHTMMANLAELTFCISFQPVRYQSCMLICLKNNMIGLKGLRWLGPKWQVQRITCCLKVYKYRPIIYVCNPLTTIQRIEPTVR